MPSFEKSLAAGRRLEELVPGGAHTYAKGPDQYPADCAPVIVRGRGAHVWDLDGNEYVEYGSGLRSVILGHAHPRIIEAVRRHLEDGENFVRPSLLELEAAEDFLAAVPTMDMVKFAKNGSDVTTAAVRLARAYTGRDLVAVCRDQPFFSTDDWFIGTTPMAAGIPSTIRDLTLTFPYGDLHATEALLDRYDGRVAALVLEVQTASCQPQPDYLQALIDLAHSRGTLVIADEMITGFRYALGGAHSLHGITPDLCTFGKAIGNGFAVAALAGRRDIMELGGLRTDADRVFLLSTTHGAEGVGLAAHRATIAVHRREDTAARLADLGGRLKEAVDAAVAQAGLSAYVQVKGDLCNLVYVTLDSERQPSQPFRTLFMRGLMRGGVIGPSFVVSAALTQQDIDRTADAVAALLPTYAAALEAPDPTPFVGGRAVKPVFRTKA